MTGTSAETKAEEPYLTTIRLPFVLAERLSNLSRQKKETITESVDRYLRHLAAVANSSPAQLIVLMTRATLVLSAMYQPGWLNYSLRLPFNTAVEVCLAHTALFQIALEPSDFETFVSLLLMVVLFDLEVRLGEA